MDGGSWAIYKNCTNPAAFGGDAVSQRILIKDFGFKQSNSLVDSRDAYGRFFAIIY